MKAFLTTILFVVSGVVAEAPYPASGWRPSGPSFELPQRGQNPQKQYLPPIDPRVPLPPVDFGSPDVSVQGLPPQEDQQPLFQASPISGQQYSGPDFDKDLRSLNQNFQQSQYQQQQERYRQLQRQRELEAAQAANNNRLPTPQSPRVFARTTTTTEAPTTPESSPSFDQNQEDVLSDDKSEKLRNGKVSVEVTKQNVKEYPGEFFLGSLAQIQLQPLQPISGAYIQGPSERTGFDAATHFAAFPSVLAQQNQYQSPAVLPDQQVLVQQPLAQYQPSIQPQQDSVLLQAPAQFQPNVFLQPSPNVAVQPQYQPLPVQPATSYQPAIQPNPDAVSIQPQYQPQPQYPQGFQIQAQQVIYEPQSAEAGEINQPGQFLKPQPEKKTELEEDDEEDSQDNKRVNQQPILVQQPGFIQEQPQFYQPQIQYLQPQGQFAQAGQFTQPQGQYAQPLAQLAQQSQFVQPQSEYAQPTVQLAQQSQFAQPQGQYDQSQSQYPQPQDQFIRVQFAQAQGQPQREYLQPRQSFQNQDALQSGLDVNRDDNDGNDIDQKEDEPEGATAVATAFGTRTQPRIQPQYGVPYPVPRVQANPGASTTESPVEEIEGGPAVAQATAVAEPRRERNGRLRSRRIRPVYAVDRSGRLVLAEA